jgi:hypothetical protein
MPGRRLNKMENILARISKTETRRRLLLGAFALIIFLLVLWAGYLFLPIGLDWRQTYYPAAKLVLNFKSPYTIEIFHSPPWAVLPLIPLALLPIKLANAMNFCLSMAVTVFVAGKLGAKPATIIALLVSYPILFMVAYGQVDWLIFLGFILPPRWGLFLVLIKPQASIGIIIYWFIDAMCLGGIRKVAETFSPVVLALLLSWLLFGNWLGGSLIEIDRGYNASLWPWSIPIGIFMLLSAVRFKRAHLAIAASPFLSPYLAPHGWSATLLGISPLQFETIVAVLGIWILRLVTGPFLH